jgi:hypothetical protein
MLTGLAWLLFGASFVSVVSFLVAVPGGQAGVSPEWSAGVFNQGRYYQWWTIRDNPILFGTSCVVLINAGAFCSRTGMDWINKRMNCQQKSGR